MKRCSKISCSLELIIAQFSHRLIRLEEIFIWNISIFIYGKDTGSGIYAAVEVC